MSSSTGPLSESRPESTMLTKPPRDAACAIQVLPVVLWASVGHLGPHCLGLLSQAMPGLTLLCCQCRSSQIPVLEPKPQGDNIGGD